MENQESDNIEQQIMASLNEMEDDDREFVALHLTPEFAEIMGIFFGDAFGSVFKKLADHSKILVPVNRETGTESVEQPSTVINPQTSEATSLPPENPSL